MPHYQISHCLRSCRNCYQQHAACPSAAATLSSRIQNHARLPSITRHWEMWCKLAHILFAATFIWVHDQPSVRGTQMKSNIKPVNSWWFLSESLQKIMVLLAKLIHFIQATGLAQALWVHQHQVLKDESTVSVNSLPPHVVKSSKCNPITSCYAT
jgi:hypothetical protein